MGCILGVCAAQVACCCCSSACHLCCACCPNSVSSIMTRLMYTFLIILGILSSSVFLIPAVKEKMSKDSGIPFYKRSGCELLGLDKHRCDNIMGYSSVYRVWFGFVMFFLLMTIIMIGVRSSKDFRSGIQNGFWIFKILIIIGVIVGAFFIRDPVFNDVWMYIGIIGGVLFILLQVLFLVDFAHSWNESWLGNAENSKGWYVALGLCMFIMYGLSIAAVVCMYVYFADSGSTSLKKGLISVNLILCVVLSLIAILPKVQEANPRSGLLQASLVTLYVTYLTLSSVTSAPAPQKFMNSVGSDGGNAARVVGIFIAILMVFYLSFKSTGSSSSVADVDEEAPVQKVSDDEEDAVQYSYSFFHATCFLACLYCMMVMTNWLKPETADNIYTFKPNLAAVWVQIVSSWVCVALYIWTLVAPLCCPDRTFSWVGGD